MTTTPNKSLQFSPVAISPRAKTVQGKNLTGNPRIVRDLTAAIHSNIQQWNTLHLNGLSLLKTITSLKTDNSYPEKLKQPCENLTQVCNKLDNIVEAFGQIVNQMKSISKLHKSSDHLFSTWPVDKFVATAHMIYESYKKEAEVKQIILENVAHDHRDAMKMLNLAAWVHQTQLPDNLNINLESMLVETKLR
ncbi:cyclin-dependent kinase 2-interacting protein [Copidosoma floridanum]|uniref:cyclin-dependent kinase 2-interacting protein n=1 Tax=Copidosoma floridanum TaxID=29053 RepID=UPI0006C9DC11|nr:cyclin-dependent kinase 2-interacting protein [Copidosoma floridanum]